MYFKFNKSFYLKKLRFIYNKKYMCDVNQTQMILQI